MAVKEERGVSKKPVFLAAFIATARIDKAAQAAKIDRSLHYRWLSEDPEYAKEFESARLKAGETLQDEAVRRAYAGYDEPVIYQGGLCYALDQFEKDDAGKPTPVLKKNAKPLTVRKYDSGLLHKLLDGFLPERYKRRGAFEVSGKDGAPILVKNEGLAKLTDEELASLIALAGKLSTNDEK